MWQPIDAQEGHVFVCVLCSVISIIPSILLEITGGAEILSLSKSASKDQNPDVK